ncbi:protoporphyrinogen/coproporphyrinogen III oxidase [Myxococcaceae bacterium]|jgi:oxygen-dependent protoporphyrinogen oxidase|nr:protoporphyrinogen/coproporphyrinogen III oxidase [Myxococcaceae bacterium]
MASILVVGGGIAGLAAAHRLQQLGHRATVLEREPVAGGRMRSERIGEFIVDRGAQFIASGYRNLRRVAGEVGLGPAIRPLARTHNAMLRSGRLEAGNYDSPLAFLRSRLLSTRAKLRLPRILLELLRHRAILDPLHPERAAVIDREDVPSFVRRLAGDENLEYLLGPALSSTFDSDPEDLSAAFLLLALRFVMGGFGLECFEGGIGRLGETLASRLDVRTSCDVVSVETGAWGARVRHREGGGDREAVADAAIVAVPGPLAPAICPRLTDAEREFLEAVHYVRGIVVFLLLDRAPQTLPYYGVAFPRPEGIDLYGLAVDHHKPGVCPPGAGLLNAALTARAAARLWDSSDDAIAGHVLDELARTPVGRLEPHGTAVHRWDPMLPQFRAGYLPRLAAFLARRERSPRLAFAGDYLVGPYTECALTSGLRAAGEVVASLAR